MKYNEPNVRKHDTLLKALTYMYYQKGQKSSRKNIQRHNEQNFLGKC